LKNSATIILLICILGVFSSCEEKESNITEPIVSDTTDIDTTYKDPTFENELVVKSQMLSQYKLIVEKVSFKQNGWLIVRPSKLNVPDMDSIISKPLFVESGTYENLAIELIDRPSYKERKEERKVWIILHTDDGNSEVFEYELQSSLDEPIKDEKGDIIKKSIKISAPYIESETQEIFFSVEVTAHAAVDSWLVAYETKSRGRVIGKRKIKAGINKSVRFDVDIDIDEQYPEYIVVDMYIDDGTDPSFRNHRPELFEFYGYDFLGKKNYVSENVWDKKD